MLAVNIDPDVVSAAGSVAGVVVALGALGVALFAYRVSRRSTDANLRLVAVEERREHADLRPNFSAVFHKVSDSMATIAIELVGPPQLDGLDQVELSLRDDKPRGGSLIAGGPSLAQVRGHVWGPYRLRRGVDGADSAGRVLQPFALALGDQRVVALDSQTPPPWATSSTGDWQREYAGMPVRLKLRCYRDGHKPWTVLLQVEVPQEIEGSLMA